MAEQSPRERVESIMKDAREATLTYVDDEGRLVSTPMGTQDVDDPGTVWFITALDAEKVAAIRQRPQVNVAYSTGEGWVSLAGTAAVNEDRDKLRELWSAGASAFLSGDADDPNNGLLEITADTAEYWESPGKVGMAVQFVKGLVSDDRPDMGDSGVVQL